MSTAARLVKLAEGLDSNGILSAAKGGTGNTTGGGTTSPTVSQIAYPGDDTAASTSGGQTITLTGTNFASGAKVLINNTQVSVVTVVSSTQITFTSPALTAGSYILYVVNTDGSTAIAVPGIQVSGVPAWTTAAGTLGTTYETQAISATLAATSDSAVTYSLFSGTLPTGAILNSNGTISGTSPLTASSTTYTFTIRATDAEKQDTDRTFSLTINPDVVSWSSPANGATLSGNANIALTATTLSATSAAGSSVTYTANSLPTGVTLSGSTISGTPTTAGTSSTTLTATAATTSKTAQITINWTIVVGGDAYFPVTTLLLNAETTAVPFVTDNSTNNQQLTVVGDTKPLNFNPYAQGYYSNYFNGSTDNIVAPASTAFAFGTGDFTIEFWVNIVPGAAVGDIFANYRANTASDWQFYWDGANLQYYPGGSSSYLLVALKTGTWYHIAACRQGDNVKLYINGVLSGTSTGWSASSMGANQTVQIGAGAIGVHNDGFFTGYVSNARIVKGTAVYTSAFTPPTAPLTAIINTSLLTCQSTRFIDNSLNNSVITRSGNPTVQSTNPFGVPASVATNNLYSAYFDGTGDYLSTPSLISASGDFTIECWFNTPTTLSGYRMLCGGAIDATASNYLAIYTSGVEAQFGSGSATVTTAAYTFVPNTWYHLAITRSGTTIKIYVNGVSLTTVQGSQAGAFAIRYLGNGYTGLTYTGFISNFRFVNGTAVYTANFTPPTTTLTAITGTQLLTCQDATLRDNSTNNFTITSFGDARPVTVSPFVQTTTVVPLTGVGSTYFDGTGDYLSVPASSLFYLSTGDWTVEAWVYKTTSTKQIIVSQTQNAASPYSGWLFYVNASNLLVFEGNNGASIGSPTVAVPLNAWTHVAAVKSGSTITLYQNGVKVNSGSVPAITDFSTQLGIGNYSTPPGGEWNGYISDLRITKGSALYTANFAPPTQPLTAVTNTSLLTCQTNQPTNNQMFVDNSTSALPITYVGSATQGSFAPYGANWSNYFDGAGDYLSITEPAATSSVLTIECWVYPVTQVYTGDAFIVGDAGNAAGAWALSFNSSTRTIGVWLDSYSSITITSNNTLSYNAWNHIALVKTGGIIYLYINGTRQTATYSQAGSFGRGTTINIGRYTGGGQEFTGYISNLRMVYGTAVYTGTTYTVPTQPLTAITGTQLLTCQDNRLVDNSLNAYTITRAGDVSVQKFSPFATVTQTPQTYSTYLDGTGDYLTVPYNANLSIPVNTAFTFECWAYATSASSFIVACMNWGWGGSGPTWGFLLSNGTTPNWSIAGTGETTYNMISASTVTGPLNQWNHYVWTRDSSNVCRIFVNGVQGGSRTDGQAMSAASGNIYLGTSSNLAAGYGQGYISNARFVLGTGLYTASFTPPTAPLTAVTGTSMLVCQDSTLKDNSIYAATVTAYGDAKARPQNPLGYTTSSVQDYSPAVFGSSVYSDNTATIYNNTASPIAGSTIDWTMEAWCYFNAFTSNVWVMGLGNNTGGNTPYLELRIAGTGTSIVLLETSTVSAIWTLTGSLTFTTGQWYHLAGTRSGTTLRLFVNGTQVATGTYAGAIQAGLKPFSQGLLFSSGGARSDGVNGYVSDARMIAGTALYTANFVPPTQPLTAVKGTSYLINGDKAGIQDKSGKFNLQTVGDARVAAENPYSGAYYSNYFNGTTDYLTVASNAAFGMGAGDFTIEFWAYSTVNARQDWIDISDSTNRILFYYTGTAVAFYGNGTTNITGSALVLNTWNHYALVKSSGSTKMYVNGIQAGSTYATSQNYGTTSSVTVGKDSFGSTYITGNISNLRIVKGTAVYTTAFTPPTQPLTAVTNTQLLTCQSNRFVDLSANAFAVTKNGSTAIRGFNPWQRNTGGSLYFDGSGDYLTVPNNAALQPSTGDFTIEAWVYLTTLGTAKSIISTYNNAATGYWDWQVKTTNVLELSRDSGSVIITGTTVLASNTWYHVAVSRSGTAVKQFINGVLDASSTSAGSLSSANSTAIGSTVNNINNFAGYIDDLRVTRGYARYTANFTPPTTTLLTK